jgi:alpha-ketoglutarate-dependent taurine dioxygenase
MDSAAPLTHPAAWCGSELLTSPDWQITLEADALDEWIHAARQSPINQLQQLALPTLAPTLQHIQHHLEHGCGAAMIRGLSPEHLDALDASESRQLFFGLTAHIGTPVSQSADGETVFSVRDAGYAKDDPRARGPNTARKLSFHTDRCDVIAFLCLQQAKSGGENQLVSSMAIYNQILAERPDLLDVLREPFLYKRHSVDTANAQPYCKQPIFSFQEAYFACAFLRVLIERAYADEQTPTMTDAQHEALNYLEQVADRPDMHVQFKQEPGDILLLNNWVTLHRRTAFEDHDDAAMKRHILRIWLSVPNSRPLHPLFVDNYGAIEAGVIRGGMTAS